MVVKGCSDDENFPNELGGLKSSEKEQYIGFKLTILNLRLSETFLVDPGIF